MHTESNMKFLSNSFLGVKNDDAEIWIFFSSSSLKLERCTFFIFGFSQNMLLVLKKIDFQDKKCKFGSLWKNALAASVVNFLEYSCRIVE